MCRAVAVPCDGEEDDGLVRGVAREGGSVREPCARIGFQGCLLRWASGPWENPQLYLLSPRRNGSAPACSARRRSGKGPGTRPGQASLLCADGRTRDSAREHEEADYVCRSSSLVGGTPGSTTATPRAHSTHRATASDGRGLQPGDLIGYTKQ
ncbi:hypothetical protein MTO96_005767 [Rhipicephalus appendiculatus]